MEKKMEQFPAKNPNPVLGVANDGTVLYSNIAGEPLLHEWGVEVGEKLPSNIGDLVHRVIYQNIPEKMEVIVGKRVYMLAFHPLSEEEYVNIYGFDISDQKELEEKIKIELTKRKKTDSELLKVYKKIQEQSEELQVFNEELQVQSEELHEANEALQKSEKRFRTLAENSPDVITRFDRQNRHIYINLAASEAYGLSQEEIIGKTHGELGRNPELVKFLETYQEIVFTTGKPETIEFHYKSPQGKEYYFNTKIVPEFVDGKVTSILAISRDITERKKTEEALRKAHNSLEEKVKERTLELEEAYKLSLENERRLDEAQEMAHIGSWDRNLTTNELYWSDETYRIFGFKPKEFVSTYDAFLSQIHPDDRDYVDDTIRKALNGKPFGIDFRIILADGTERVVHAQGGAAFDEKNMPIQLKGTIQDITERKKVEEALAKIEISRKQEIHHRIKNNLQVISSLLDLEAEQFRNRDDIKDSEVLEAFRESQDRVISMALIHEELYKGGDIDTLDFSPYIEELAENLFLTYRIKNKNISLNTDLEDDLFFDMDTAVPLGMIVNELVSNSLKHAFQGRDRGEIRIKLRREENAECINSIEESKIEDCKSTSFNLIVSDNGVGIPENLDIENLDSLGIQLVTSLVDQLDGELELKRNSGTEFFIRFTVIEKINQESAPASQQLVE